MDRGSWWAAAHGVTKSQTQLSIAHTPILNIIQHLSFSAWIISLSKIPLWSTHVSKMTGWPSFSWINNIPSYISCLIASVVSNSVHLYGLQPTKLLCPWSSLGKSTGMGCHALLQETFPTQGSNCLSLMSPESPAGRFFTTSATWEAYIYCCCSVAKSCPTLCNPMDCNTPGIPILHHLLELAQTHIHWVSDAIQTSHPLSAPSPPAYNLSQRQGLF